MNIMKKIASAMTALSVAFGMVVIPASAECVNEYGVSYEALTQSVEIAGGYVVPAGSIAVTLSIDNNNGFNSNTTILHVADGFEALTNRDNKVVVQMGDVLSDPVASGNVSVNGSKICIAMGSADISSDDGDLFTVYLIPDNTNVENTKEIVSVEYAEFDSITNQTVSKNVKPNLQTRTEQFLVGDVTLDGLVNSSDGTAILVALDHYHNSINPYMPFIPVDTFLKTHVSWVFPNYPTMLYRAPDVEPDYDIDDIDANAIYDYATLVGTGNIQYYQGRIGTYEDKVD